MEAKKVHPEKVKGKEEAKGKDVPKEKEEKKKEVTKKPEKKEQKESEKKKSEDEDDDEDESDDKDDDDYDANQGKRKSYYVPKELKVLEKTHLIIVQHKLSIYQVDYGFATNNRYHIFDNFGNKIFDAAENGKFVCICNDGYDFNLNVYSKDTPVMTCNVPYNFWHSCFGKSKGNDDMEIKSGYGSIIGYVHQENYNPPKFRIEDNEKDTVFYIKGPKVEGRLSWRFIGEGEFSIFTADESMKIGKIARVKDDVLGDEVENGENFGVEWPQEVNAGDKATLICAVFLIDYMYFERIHNKKQAVSHGIKKGKYGDGKKAIPEVENTKGKEAATEDEDEKESKPSKKGPKADKNRSKMCMKSGTEKRKKKKGAAKKKPDDLARLDGGGGSDVLFLLSKDFAIGSYFFFTFGLFITLLMLEVKLLYRLSFT